MNRIQKSKLTFVLITALYFIALSCFSQTYGSDNSSGLNQKFPWPEGKQMALSLTFDDARLSQIDTGIPLLDKYGVKATFYISPGNMLERINGWKQAVTNGHDIGNHSVYHQC